MLRLVKKNPCISNCSTYNRPFGAFIFHRLETPWILIYVEDIVYLKCEFKTLKVNFSMRYIRAGELCEECSDPLIAVVDLATKS